MSNILLLLVYPADIKGLKTIVYTVVLFIFNSKHYKKDNYDCCNKSQLFTEQTTHKITR